MEDIESQWHRSRRVASLCEGWGLEELAVQGSNSKEGSKNFLRPRGLSKV